jgi:3-oxoacyl-[acyl-carrier-protein] synthase-3
MDGRGIFDFAMRQVPEDVRRCLDLNGLNLADVDYFVFHQASRYILEWLGKRLQAPPEKMFYAMEETGNTVSSSIPLALARLRAERDLEGKKVLICGFGGGLSWACTVLQF